MLPPIILAASVGVRRLATSYKRSMGGVRKLVAFEEEGLVDNRTNVGEIGKINTLGARVFD
jgi:hypothetical protein